MSRPILRLVVALVFLLSFASPARAQIDTGTIVGRVVDESGAVLPGVRVVATQNGTNVSSSTITNASGEYVFPGLKIGTYEIAAELQGFRRALQKDVALNVQARVQVDLALEVGALSEQVVVEGRTALLQTQSADIGSIVDERQLRDLPLLGRRYSELAFLSPAWCRRRPAITSRGEDTFFNANGNYATWNNYTLDGADNNSLLDQPAGAQPASRAAAGRRAAGVQGADAHLLGGVRARPPARSSTPRSSREPMRFAATLFEFFRDEAFNANTWDNDRAGRPKGKFNQHIAGGTLGGPIVRQQDVLLRRLSGDAHRTGADADGDGADRR